MTTRCSWFRDHPPSPNGWAKPFLPSTSLWQRPKSADPLSHEPELLNGGKTMLISIGKKGKYVGVVGFHPNEPKPLQFHLVTLNRRFDGAGAPMKALIEDEYRQTLKAAGVVENFVRRPPVSGAPGATFVGADTCKDCHPNTFDKWKNKTKHSKAFEALLHDPKPNTAFDAECITCHTTGFEFISGWKSPNGNSATWPAINAKTAMAQRRGTFPTLTTPSSASSFTWTANNSTRPGFATPATTRTTHASSSLTKFWGEIVHKGLDTYNDPKVHKGITPAPKGGQDRNLPAPRSEARPLRGLAFPLVFGKMLRG